MFNHNFIPSYITNLSDKQKTKQVHSAGELTRTKRVLMLMNNHTTPKSCVCVCGGGGDIWYYVPHLANWGRTRSVVPPPPPRISAHEFNGKNRVRPGPHRLMQDKWPIIKIFNIKTYWRLEMLWLRKVIWYSVCVCFLCCCFFFKGGGGEFTFEIWYTQCLLYILCMHLLNVDCEPTICLGNLNKPYIHIHIFNKLYDVLCMLWGNPVYYNYVVWAFMHGFKTVHALLNY